MRDDKSDPPKKEQAEGAFTKAAIRRESSAGVDQVLAEEDLGPELVEVDRPRVSFQAVALTDSELGGIPAWSPHETPQEAPAAAGGLSAYLPPHPAVVRSCASVVGLSLVVAVAGGPLLGPVLDNLASGLPWLAVLPGALVAVGAGWLAWRRRSRRRREMLDQALVLLAALLGALGCVLRLLGTESGWLLVLVLLGALLLPVQAWGRGARYDRGWLLARPVYWLGVGLAVLLGLGPAAAVAGLGWLACGAAVRDMDRVRSLVQSKDGSCPLLEEDEAAASLNRWAVLAVGTHDGSLGADLARCVLEVATGGRQPLAKRLRQAPGDDLHQPLDASAGNARVIARWKALRDRLKKRVRPAMSALDAPARAAFLAELEKGSREPCSLPLLAPEAALLRAAVPGSELRGCGSDALEAEHGSWLRMGLSGLSGLGMPVFWKSDILRSGSALRPELRWLRHGFGPCENSTGERRAKTLCTVLLRPEDGELERGMVVRLLPEAQVVPIDGFAAQTGNEAYLIAYGDGSDWDSLVEGMRLEWNALESRPAGSGKRCAAARGRAPRTILTLPSGGWLLAQRDYQGTVSEGGEPFTVIRLAFSEEDPCSAQAWRRRR